MTADWKNKKRLIKTCIALGVSLLIPLLCTSAVGQTTASCQPKANEGLASSETGPQEKTVPANSASVNSQMQKTLGDIVFTVQDIYYDGRVAMLTVRRTALKTDTVIADELFCDNPNGKPLYGEKGETAIPTYCDISFYFGKDGERSDYLASIGGSMSRGNPLDSYGLVSLIPLDVSPDSLESVITMATLTPQLDTYKEMDSINVSIPKTDKPLVDAAPDLDMGSTVVKHIVVSRTSLMLVVYVYHQPLRGNGDRSFSVYPCGDEVLRDLSGDVEELEKEGLVYAEITFALSKDDPLPEALRLHYNGGASKDLKVNLSTGGVEVLDQ